jgi:uncharacterized protein with HEPN domain
MRNYKLYLKGILSAMESIEEFVKGMDFESLKKTIRRQVQLSEKLRS